MSTGEPTNATTNDTGPLSGPVSYAIDCIVMDTETTGFSVHRGDRLIEVAAIPIVHGITGTEWSSLVYPGRHIPVDATRVHGITDNMVGNAPPPESLAVELRQRLGDRMLCFHNAPFDLPFLRCFLEEGGAEPMTNPVVDTLGLARSCYGFGSHANNSLVSINARLGLPVETAHRALADARMTARVLVLLAGWHERHRGIASFAELAALSLDVMRVTNLKTRTPWR